jgi:dihydroorotate dehydrogenase electron transfer subunit
VASCIIADVRRLTKTASALAFIWPGVPPAPGNFVNIKCGGAFLRRPISVADFRGREMTVVFELRGEGTRWLSRCAPGETLDVLGPFGHGFAVPDAPAVRDILLVGGGVGAAPLLFAARRAQEMGIRAAALLGFRGIEQVMLEAEFTRVSHGVYIMTDDGSYGFHGAPPLIMPELLKNASAVLTCGPRGMMKRVAELAAEHGVPCQVSLEERMACGVGACLVCACKTRTDGETRMSRVCTDGPVFAPEEVVWDE